MVDSDNVLLLRPARASSGFAGAERDQRAAGIVTASIFYLGRTPAEAFAAFFAETMRPRLESLGASVLAEFVTETRPNNFRRCRCAKKTRCSSGSVASIARRHNRRFLNGCGGKARGEKRDRPRCVPRPFLNHSFFGSRPRPLSPPG